ncbi:MAG: rhomboid family intramembrane serine protease [Solobacterium sp.]|nr:rhomboid family intramembrane serine protease [Solobacterium sp.]
MYHLPYVTYAAGIICIAAYILKTKREQTAMSSDVLLEMGVMYNPYVRLGQYYRLITAGFLHFSIWHLFMNMYVLWNLGSYMERMFGHVLYAVLLLGSVILGNLMVLMTGDDHTISAGMSGGLYGLMVAELALIMKFYGVEEILRGTSFMYMILLNLAMNFMPGVGWRAHLGGACFGAIFTVLVLNIL